MAENSATCFSCRRLREDGFHGIGEAHVQHLVGFVEHHGADAIELQRAALQVIDDAARRADDHLRAALQRAELRHIALAAVDGQHMEGMLAGGVFLERFGDLDGQLARRHQHQRLRHAILHVRVVDRIGSAKAAVLPVPVCAWPRMSAPSSIAGMVAAWMGEADS